MEDSLELFIPQKHSEITKINTENTLNLDNITFLSGRISYLLSLGRNKFK